MKRILVGCLLMIALSTEARGEFVIGYNVGFYSRAHYNLQAQAQAFNYLSGSELKTPLQMGGFYRGLVLGIQTQGDKWIFGLRFNTKKALSNTGENTTQTQRFRFRMNSYQMDFAFGGERVKLGASVDLCFVRVHTKFSDQTKSREKPEWEDYYKSSGLFGKAEMVVSSNFFLNIRLGRFLELRPFVQLPYFPADFLSSVTQKNYVHSVLNYGTSLCLTLGSD